MFNFEVLNLEVDCKEAEQKLPRAIFEIRAQLYGLGYPRQPSPRVKFIERLHMKTWFL